MVRKIIFTICFCLLFSCNVFAYDVYNDGSIGSTYVNYFNDVLNNYPNKDYVIWRNSQYDYCLAVGELEYNNSTYSGDVDIYIISTNQQYNYSLRLIKSHSSLFSLSNPNRIIVYSSLGDMPNVQERGSTYEFAEITILCIACIFVLVWSVLKHGTS